MLGRAKMIRTTLYDRISDLERCSTGIPTSFACFVCAIFSLGCIISFATQGGAQGEIQCLEIQPFLPSGCKW